MHKRLQCWCEAQTSLPESLMRGDSRWEKAVLEGDEFTHTTCATTWGHGSRAKRLKSWLEKGEIKNAGFQLCNTTGCLWDCTWPTQESPCQFEHRWPWGCLHSGCCPAPLPLRRCSWSPDPGLHILHRTQTHWYRWQFTVHLQAEIIFLLQLSWKKNKRCLSNARCIG